MLPFEVGRPGADASVARAPRRAAASLQNRPRVTPRELRCVRSRLRPHAGDSKSDCHHPRPTHVARRHRAAAGDRHHRLRPVPVQAAGLPRHPGGRRTGRVAGRNTRSRRRSTTAAGAAGSWTRLPDIQAMDAAASDALAVILRESPRYANLAIADASGRWSPARSRSPARCRSRSATSSPESWRPGSVRGRRVPPQPGLFAAGPRRGLPPPRFDGRRPRRHLDHARPRMDGGLRGRSNLPPDAVLLVFDAEGTVVTRSIDPAQWTGRKVYSADAFHEMRRSRVGTATVTGVDGVERLFALSWVTDGGRDARGGRGDRHPDEDRERGRVGVARPNLGILLAGALACLGLTWLAADRFFLRETRALLGTARALKAGDVSARTGISEGPGELRDVARALDAGLEAVARQLRVAREIQMGFLPVSLAAATRGTPPRRAGGHRAGPEGGRRSLRGPPRRRRPRGRRVGRRVGQGLPGGAVHGGGGDRPPHPGPQHHRPGRDPEAPERRTRRAEPARDVRDDPVPRVRPGGEAGHVRGRRPPPARHPVARSGAAAGVSLVGPAGRPLAVQSDRERVDAARAGRHVRALLGRRQRGDERGATTSSARTACWRCSTRSTRALRPTSSARR